MADTWNESFRVRSYETDPTGRAAVETLCNYLQEIAGNHALALGVSVEQLQEHRQTWVLARLRLQIEAYPSWRDDVTVETWPSGVDGLLATRDFLLRDDAGRGLGRATSGWMMIDVDRRRPVRLPDLITSIRIPDRPRALESLSSRLPDPANASEMESKPIRVRYKHLDVNGHVNNVRYVEWALDALPVEHLRSSSLRELEVHFRAEAVLGDSVSVRWGSPDAEGSSRELIHVIVQTDTGKELARVHSLWSPR